MVREKTRFIPVDPDEREYTDLFECEHCQCEINAGWYLKKLDYNFCPWCGAEVEEAEENE